MEMNTITGMPAHPSAFVVPTLGAGAAVCPQAGFRRTDAFEQAFAAAVTGPRTWSPPIT